MGEIEEIAMVHYNGLIEEFNSVGIDADISYDHLVEMWKTYSDNVMAKHKENGKIVGFLGLWKGKPMIYVTTEYQRQGIGSKLLNKVYAGVVWVMDGNIKAEKFYKKNGYEPTESRETTKLGHDITETKWVNEAS